VEFEGLSDRMRIHT